MTRLFALVLLLAAQACATGFGEAATGRVDVIVVPVGTVPGGVSFEQMELTVAEVVLEPEGEDPSDDGHGHSHLVQPAWARPGADVRTIDLLGGEQTLESLEMPAAHYESVSLLAADASSGDGAGCALFARGTAETSGNPVPIRICLLADGALATVPIELEVGRDDRIALRILSSANGILTGIDLSRVPLAGGAILLDDRSTPFEAAKLRRNLASAFFAGDDEHGDDHDP